MNGNGLELISSHDSGVRLDIDHDGFAEQVGWVGAGDAILAADFNLDGRVQTNEFTFSAFAPEGGTDLEGLRKFDENGDGILDESDAIFSQLVLWQDLNQNGVSEENEVTTAAAAGLESITLFGDTSGEVLNGNIVFEYVSTSFVGTDGNLTTLTAGDVGLEGFAYTGNRIIGADSEVTIREYESGHVVANFDYTSQTGVRFNLGRDAINGTSMIDIIVGSAGNDRFIISSTDGGQVFGGAGNDKIIGGAGNDTLVGRAGDDKLKGGDGEDYFFVGDGHDTIRDFEPGSDLILISGLTFEDLERVLSSAESKGDGVLITINDNDSVWLKGVDLEDIDADDFSIAS